MVRTSPLLRFGLPMVAFCVLGYAGLSRFLVGKTDKMDSHIRKRSERAVQLEMAHKAIVGHMNLEEYEIKPVPPPPPIADEK